MNRIRFLREEAGLTQEVLAKKIGVSRQVLGNYEKEINYPSPDLLCKFADFFDCSIDYLIGRSDDLGVISITNEKSSSLAKDEQEMLDIYRALQPMHRSQVLEYARYTADRAGVLKNVTVR